MPGMLGLITKQPRDWAEPQLLRMVKALTHESFYVTGTWIDETLGVYVGWVARKGSFADGMPVRNETGDAVLVFAGEDFPEPGTVRRLQDKGHNVAPQGPSYLVHLYEEDPAFLVGLNGRFHGLLADRRQGTVTLFNDRYGMYRLYHHESKDAFYFGAEAKAILAARPELRRADPQALGELIAYSCVLQNRTIFENIHTLPGGSAWSFRNGALAAKSYYFQPGEWEEQSSLEAEPYYQELRQSISRNLPRYFGGQERVGMSLTGGLDTRMIIAWQKPAPQSLPCYTFGGSYRECQDVRVGRKIARLCDQPYQVVPVGEEFLSQFSRYAERSVYLTEGGIDVYRSADLYVSEKARAVAPVKIVGTYGSEIIRQAVMFKPMPPMPGLFRPEFLSRVDQAGKTYAEVRRAHPVTFAAFRQSPWYHYGILYLEESQLTVRSPYLDNDFIKTVFRAPQPLSDENDVRLRLIRDGNPGLGRLRSDRGIGGNGNYLLNAAARAYLEFTFKAEYAYDYGMPQWVSRTDHMFSAFHLERLFLGRHKLLHFRVWYRDRLKEYVRQMLLDPRTLSRPYLDPKGVETVVEGHLKGGRNYTTEIHKLLTLELVQRLFFDAQ